MNKGFASGFISSDIKSETINTKNGEMKKITFSIACSRKTKGEADFPWFEVFGKTAENIEKYFSKGRGIIVTYHIQTGKYTTKEGKPVFTTTHIVDDFEFPPVRKNEESTPVEHSPYDVPQEQPQQTAQTVGQPQPQEESEFMKIPEGIELNLPFR